MHLFKISLVIGLLLLCHSLSWADESGDPNCLAQKISDKRFQDEVWLLSCRSLGCVEHAGAIPAKNLTVDLVSWQYNLEGKRWSKTPYERLLKTGRHLETVLWVHGNLTTATEAFATGLRVYRNLVSDRESRLPVRFIIWSWPASKVLNRPVPDARVKAARTTWAGLRLAGLLDQMPNEASVSLLGFSFGARVVAAALELLAGGELNGKRIKNLRDDQSYRVTLFAAALDSHWLLPGSRFGSALKVISHLTLLTNDCDWILKHYGKLYGHCGRRGPAALGYTGLNVGILSTGEKEKIKQFNVSPSLGKEHTLQAYLNSRSATQRIREGVFQKTSLIQAETTPKLSKSVYLY